MIEAVGVPVRAPETLPKQTAESLREMLHRMEKQMGEAGMDAVAEEMAALIRTYGVVVGPLLKVLLQASEALARGLTVRVVAVDEELTTQQAADILGVSRPYLIRLLESGKIPFTKVGTHRRVRMTDLLAYKEQRDAERREALQELTRTSQELGLYD